MAIDLPNFATISIETWLSILAIVVSASGWIAWLFELFTQRPKITGRIQNVIRGTLQNPDRELTAFTVLLYLTNSHRNAVHIIQYDMEIDVGKGFERVHRAWDTADLNINLGSWIGRGIQIPDFKNRLMWRQDKPVEFGLPLKGILLFLGDINYYRAEVKQFRLICTDVFGHKHKVTTKPKDFPALEDLEDFFGVKVMPEGT